MPLGLQRPFGPTLAAIGGIGPRPFPPRAVPWSSPRPSPATPSRSRSPHRRRAVRRAKVWQTRQQRTRLGTGRGPCWTHPGSGGAPSTDSRSAGRRRCRPSSAAPDSRDDHPWDAGSQGEAEAPSAPTAHPGSATHRPHPRSLVALPWSASVQFPDRGSAGFVPVVG